jgi:phosphotransacetylase
VKINCRGEKIVNKKVIKVYQAYINKIGGILLCNDSHGDASLAKHDEDYKLIAVIENNKIKNKNLEKFFELANGKLVNIRQVKEKMKSPKYQKMAENYLFRKVK